MKIKKITYLFFTITIACLILGARAYSQIVINEFQAYNASDYLDQETGNYSDWIELFNEGNSSVNLSGYSLTDDINDPQKWLVPSGISIPANGYVILWADKLDYNRHMSFSIKGKEGQIVLFRNGSQVLDSVSYGLQISNISYGRSQTDKQWCFMEHSTPGTVNSNGLISIELCEKPIPNIEGGFYSGTQSITLSNHVTGTEIFYTLDGSDPTTNSSHYSGPITITKTTVLRAVSHKGGLLPSKILTHTYFIDEEFSLPVVSVSTDHKNLWDGNLGIYTQSNCQEDWERPAHIELFEKDGSMGFSYQVGMNIHGGYNQILPMKSLAIRARNKYETDEIKYKLFRDKELDSFTSFILRNSGNDWAYSMLRDGLMQSIVKGRMDIDYQEYQPSIVFINGEYWGIHNIREKMNEYFMEGNHKVDPDSVDILEKGYIVAEGDASHYGELLTFMSSHDMRIQANYLVVKDMVDIEELNNYQIAQIFFKNQDWPKGNIKKWRPQGEDGKWRWLLYDTDWGFDLFEHSDNMVEWTLAQNNWYLNFNTMLFRNNEYKYDFLQCFQSHMNTTFQPERVIQIIDSLKSGIQSEIPDHISKWGEPQSVANWEGEISEMIDFATNRITKIKSELTDYFYLGGESELSLSIENPEGGSVRIARVEMQDGFSGSYFRNIPITVEAVPEEGYYFIGWSGISSSDLQKIELTLNSDANLSARFAKDEPLRYIQFNEISSYKENAIVDESGDSVDWIEIINKGEVAVDLTGLYLTDSIANLSKHRIVDVSGSLILYPDSIIVLWADSDEEDGGRHLNFKLSNSGETLALSQMIGDEFIILDSVSYNTQLAGVSIGRIPGEGDEWHHMPPTPGTINKRFPVITGVYINEFSASNRHIVPNSNGVYCDWIEIYNDNDVPVDLGGLFLTDSLPDRTKYRIPSGIPDTTTVPSKGFLLLWADNQPQKGALHLNFGLKRNGEQIGLVQIDGEQVIDTLSFGEQYINSSCSRFPDGKSPWLHLPPTPGNNNSLTGLSGIRINEFSASNDLIIQDNYGEYDDWIEIFNGNDVAIDIGGLFITDSLAEGMKYRIPTTDPDSTTIQPGNYLLLWADNNPDQGVLHLDFKLSRKGGDIGIVHFDGKEIIDSVSYHRQYENSSLSLGEDSNWTVVPSSPGNANYQGFLSGIRINEFSASNDHLLHDAYGEYDDWIEIYNGNNIPIDLGGLYITDSLADGMKYRIPTTSPDSTTIAPKEYIVLWADNNPDQGVLHLDFKLSRQGEGIGLLTYNGKDFLDSLTYTKQYLNSSLSACEDLEWIPVPSSPGQANYQGIPSNVYINEFSASNEASLADEYGEYNDWIEIYNGNDYSIDIGGLFLTDSLAHGSKSRIPTTSPDSTTIPAKGFLILWADNQEEQGILHLDFSLSRQGEQIGLVHYDGNTVIDSISYTEQITNHSLSRYPDGSNTWISMNSTPLASNIRDEFVKIFINEFKAGVPGDESGESWVELYNCNNYEVNVGGFYLTNSLDNPGMQKIPDSNPDSTIIPPGGYLLISTNPWMQSGTLQLDFTLTGERGELGISRYLDGEYIYLDSVVYSYQALQVSTGRIRDGSNAWTDFSSPTPGKSNANTVSSVVEFEKETFNIYPNPVSNGFLYFNQTRNASLYNQWGSCIRREEHSDHLNLDGLTTGLYILRTDQGETVRVIIQ